MKTIAAKEHSAVDMQPEEMDAGFGGFETFSGRQAFSQKNGEIGEIGGLASSGEAGQASPTGEGAGWMHARARALPAQPHGCESAGRRGIALVVTLLMLSVITFLAVSFLVLTRAQRTTATVVLDEAGARTMSEAALARAQAEIIARMQMSPGVIQGMQGDFLNYGYMESATYYSPNFTNGSASLFNVNYDGAAATGDPTQVAQNIANLEYDPRPPVFIQTNLSLPNNLDFRFYIDINRNGRFETNGLQPVLDANGAPVSANNLPAYFPFTNYYFNGEPEWIGVLEYPNAPHSATNRFIGRYAYLVLPTGMTPDFNFIHNYSKSLLGTTVKTNPMPAAGTPAAVDGYVRDQGVGSWELNLAALLLNLNVPTFSPYEYTTNPGASPNMGEAFNDAYSFIRFRYGPNYGAPYPLPMNSPYIFGNNATNAGPFISTGIDEFGTMPYGYGNTVGGPWPGAYATNAYDDILQDLFDPTKTSTAFVNDLLYSGTNLDSYDRYTFQRLLSSIGTGSAPELQTYVYDDGISTIPGTLPLRLRNKVNINYDNSYQIANSLNTSAATYSNGIMTNLAPWPNALAFFTNAAESLVRSQEYPFIVTNIIVNGTLVPVTNWNHFGLTNMWVYSATNPTIRYTENLHRMLQLAANIYDATRTNAVPSPPGRAGPTPSAAPPYPSVFRPMFATDRTNVFIIGYTNMSGSNTMNQIAKEPWLDLTNALNASSNLLVNANIWGIPWVVGVVKGLPEFDRYSSYNAWYVERKLLFARYPTNGNTSLGDSGKAPQYTNQYYVMMLTNVSGMDAWNTYSMNWIPTNDFEVFASNYITVNITNNSPNYRPYGTNIGLTNYVLITNLGGWRRYTNYGGLSVTNSMIAFLQTNVISLPGNYFSEYYQTMWPLGTNTTNVPNPSYLGTNDGQYAFQPLDRKQSTTPAYDWTLAITNHVVYCLMDAGPGPNAGRIYDFVNLGPFGVFLNLTNWLNPSGPPPGTLGNGQANGGGNIGSVWDPTMLPSGLNRGVVNQVRRDLGNYTNTTFYLELNGLATNENEPYFGSPATPPSATAYVNQTLIVNDPLVHYTVGDLTLPPHASNSLVLTQNNRFEPWPTPSTIGSQVIKSNMTFKDPLITNSDVWNFPTNKFPSIGWLGRVHRGTPWQTIFLKADPPAAAANNFANWTQEWVNTQDTYPTGDYALLDLFTATPNDNAASGLLSINETNTAPWYALLSGVTVANYNTGLETIDPTTTNVDYVINGPYGINAARLLQPNGLFHHIGNILAAPALTIDSPLLGTTDASLMSDEAVEAIPQQVFGLLKVGQPQFVIYGFGQSLKPKDLYFGANNFNLCTNYQITGEYVARMVCHVVGAPNASSAKIQVDSYNILPGN